MPVACEHPLEDEPKAGVRGYLLRFASVVLLGTALLGALSGELVRRNFSSIDDANASYRDLGGRWVPQIQDEDVFYSNIGNSIAAVKAADIVFLGASFVSFGINRNTLQSSQPLSRLKVYNMAFAGVRAGEFSRRVITHWNIRAPLWIINVDDHVQSFFTDNLDLTLGQIKTPITAVQRSWMNGYLTVARRDLKWRIEVLIAAIKAKHTSPLEFYRSVSNGDFLLADNPQYIADHDPVHVTRDPDCHTNPTVLDYARKYLKDLGGSVVFMLIPHSNACARQAVELASALNVELIMPPLDEFTDIDGGGHLDKKGAEKFTSYLAGELVKARAFRRAFSTQLD